MRKKNFAENSDDDNEFDVDEPEEIQNNASDDDWTPEQDNNSGGRRMSSRLRNIPRSRAPIIDPPTSSDEDNSDDNQNKRKAKGRRGRQPVKRAKVSSSSSPAPKQQKENSNKSVSSDAEPSSTTVNNSSNANNSVVPVKASKDFSSGAFIILKSDVDKLDEDPPLWKIDGKALLQKYIPFEQEGKTFYKNTSVYSGWTTANQDNYWPVAAIFKQQTRKEHVVEFKREQIKMTSDDAVVSSSVMSQSSENSMEATSKPKEDKSDSEAVVEKPIIKVKSFAVLTDTEAKTPAKPIDAPTKLTTPSPVPQTPGVPLKINKDYASGAFLVLRSEASIDDPPLWKIDGKSLLQKYAPFNQNGKTFYKNTAEYSGWTLTNKNNYFPATVSFKSQNKKDHIVALERIKWDEPQNSDSE